MSSAHEEDVVIAFRQAVQEELLRVQRGSNGKREPLRQDGEPVEATLQRLCARHDELEHEVALLRTIVLRMLSEPIDENALTESTLDESTLDKNAIDRNAETI